MEPLSLSRSVQRLVPFELWNNGETAPINCSGFTVSVEETSLPFVPAIQTIDAATGRFQMLAPTEQQLATVTSGRRYRIKVIWRDGADEPVEGFTMAVVFD
jgi:hypothetical protein